MFQAFFLFLSTVLNDVPVRLKSVKILDLDPPYSLLKALDILYCNDEYESVSDLQKRRVLHHGTYRTSQTSC